MPSEMEKGGKNKYSGTYWGGTIKILGTFPLFVDQYSLFCPRKRTTCQIRFGYTPASVIIHSSPVDLVPFHSEPEAILCSYSIIFFPVSMYGNFSLSVVSRVVVQINIEHLNIAQVSEFSKKRITLLRRVLVVVFFFQHLHRFLKAGVTTCFLQIRSSWSSSTTPPGRGGGRPP